MAADDVICPKHDSYIEGTSLGCFCLDAQHTVCGQSCTMCVSWVDTLFCLDESLKHAQVAVSSPAAALKSVICRAAADKGAEEEAERQLVAVKKLKAEVARKEGMLKATQSELDKVPP